MPGAALEKYTLINDVSEETLQSDISNWGLPKPFSGYQKNVMAFSFTGIRSAVERLVEDKVEMKEDEKKSIGRAAQVLGFQHVAEKCVLGMKAREVGSSQGSLVVSGGVARSMAFRKMYLHYLWVELSLDCGRL
jgi:tRNA A37 threonylcarbamoyltransferase TsaD